MQKTGAGLAVIPTSPCPLLIWSVRWSTEGEFLYEKASRLFMAVLDDDSHRRQMLAK
jgi:hypothetical protein